MARKPIDANPDQKFLVETIKRNSEPNYHMGLIIEGSTQYFAHSFRGISPFYLSVPKDRLSAPYQVGIIGEYFVQGVVLDVKTPGRDLFEEEEKAIDSVLGKDVEFKLVLSRTGFSDYLYFRNSSWALLRDAGLITPDYRISIRLTKLKHGETEVKLYPLRDIT